MKYRTGFTPSAILWALTALAAFAVSVPAQDGAPNKLLAAKKETGIPHLSGAQLPVTGNGTSGQITKWLGTNGGNFIIGDSAITEDKTGKVGIGTTTPTSQLTVKGVVETTLGGVRFPDGTLQTTAFQPDQVVKSINGLHGDILLAGRIFSSIHQAAIR